MGFGLLDDDAKPSIVCRKVFGAPEKEKPVRHEAAPKKPRDEPVLKKKVASIEKVEDQFDDIFEEAASGSLYSEGSWDESESSSELLAELEALE